LRKAKTKEKRKQRKNKQEEEKGDGEGIVTTMQPRLMVRRRQGEWQ
jgi:hypothetical protein